MNNHCQKELGILVTNYMKSWDWVHQISNKGAYSQSGYPFWTQDSRILFLLSSNIESTWNKFKFKILHNSYGGGYFSHSYVILHKYIF
jgi:hypothetical protein